MKGTAMNQRYNLFRRGGVFYYEDTETGPWNVKGINGSVFPWRSGTRVSTSCQFLVGLFCGHPLPPSAAATNTELIRFAVDTAFSRFRLFAVKVTHFSYAEFSGRYFRRFCGITLMLCLLGQFTFPSAAAAAKKSAKKAPVKQAGGEEGMEETQPVKVAPIIIIKPADKAEKTLSGKYQFFLGTTHSHSIYSGDLAKGVATKKYNGVANYSVQTPADVLAIARTNFYDFYFITDHSSPEQTEYYKGGFTDEHWAATLKFAQAATTPDFLALRGYEFSRNNDPDQGGLGHMNVLNSAAWNSAYAAGHTFPWLYDWMAPQAKAFVVAQFNHPALPGGKAKNFMNYAGRTKARNEAVRLAEIWNSGESMKYVPVVQKIWALGWKVAPSAGTDVHGVFGIENRHIRTGILAERLTQEAVMEALQARRVYASVEPELHFELTLNDIEMGTSLAARPTGELTAKVFVNDLTGVAMSKVEIYGAKYEANGGGTQTLATLSLAKDQKTASGRVPDGYDFYYAAAFKEGVDTARAFSAPIWMDDN